MEDNYRLRGEIVSFGKQGLVIRHPSVRQNVSILPSEIRAVYFTDTAPPDLRARDKIFISTGHRDIIPCNITSISSDKVKYRDMFGTYRSIPRSPRWPASAWELSSRRDSGRSPWYLTTAGFIPETMRTTTASSPEEN